MSNIKREICIIKVKNEKFNIPLLGDDFYLNDIVYSYMRDTILGNEENFSILVETIETILDPEDYHLIDTILNKLLERIEHYLNQPEFSYISHYTGEIINVEYRYVQNERFATFFITQERQTDI